MAEQEKKLFKDWFDREAAEILSRQLQRVYPDFQEAAFIRQATRGLSELEFSARVSQFADALTACLPEDREQALQILTRSLPEPLPGVEQITDGWVQWPVGQFIADHGLPHYETSMTAMIELTQRFSSEFAVRPFLEAEPEKTIARLVSLCTHESPHVRRWCSEGSRPLLPWGRKLHALVKDPTPVWPILEALKDDPEPYVRTSVGNHLNDISKHHPELVVARCREWSNGAGPGRQWIIRRGLRTLIKDGHPGALDLMGFGPAHGLDTELQLSPETISLGDSVEMELTLKNSFHQPQPLLIDFAVLFVRKNDRTGRKVFKWTTMEVGPGEKRTLVKKIPMKKTTTRALYPGTHRVEVLVNGETVAEGSFEFLGGEE